MFIFANLLKQNYKLMTKINSKLLIYPFLGALTLNSYGGNVKNKLPNIIILYADDMGYGDMSCQNPFSKIHTPNLDLLASQGVRFTDGHSTCGVSTPSRYSILTGNYHWRHTNRVCDNFTRSIFSPDELTIADVLKSKGYFTAAVGKWHLGWDWDSVLKPGAKLIEPEDGWGKYYTPDMIDWTKPIKGGPIDYGFDYYFGNDCPFHPPYAMIENEKVIEVPTEIFDRSSFQAKEGDHEMRWGPMVKGWDPYKLMPNLTNKVVSLIKKQKKNTPFFIYFGLPTPHSPIIPNDQFDGSSQAGPYGDFIVETDYTVGAVMKALKEAGLDENTIVIFSSDNGPENYAMDRAENFGHNSSGGLRGIKRDIYEGGHRVPFIVKWPDKIEANRVSDEVVSQVDLMATFAALVGYKLPDNMGVDSYNLLPLLTEKESKTPFREATVFNTVKGTYAIRKGDWLYINSNTGSLMRGKKDSIYVKYFDYVSYSKEENPGLLFNIKNDPQQRNNVYRQHPEIVSSMDALLKQYVESGRSVPRR